MKRTIQIAVMTLFAMGSILFAQEQKPEGRSVEGTKAQLYPLAALPSEVTIAHIEEAYDDLLGSFLIVFLKDGTVAHFIDNEIYYALDPQNDQGIVEIVLGGLSYCVQYLVFKTVEWTRDRIEDFFDDGVTDDEGICKELREYDKEVKCDLWECTKTVRDDGEEGCICKCLDTWVPKGKLIPA
jgi:hypothetical protein